MGATPARAWISVQIDAAVSAQRLAWRAIHARAILAGLIRPTARAAATHMVAAVPMTADGSRACTDVAAAAAVCRVIPEICAPCGAALHRNGSARTDARPEPVTLLTCEASLLTDAVDAGLGCVVTASSAVAALGLRSRTRAEARRLESIDTAQATTSSTPGSAPVYRVPAQRLAETPHRRYTENSVAAELHPVAYGTNLGNRYV